MTTNSAKCGGRRLALGAAAALVCGLCVPGVRADVTGTPQSSSLPGAAYTLYLDFAGFTFTDTWLDYYQPGTTPAFGGQTTAFTAAQQPTLSYLWGRVRRSSQGWT